MKSKKQAQIVQEPQDVNPTKFYNFMVDVSESQNLQDFSQDLRDLCVKFNVKMDLVNKTIDV